MSSLASILIAARNAGSTIERAIHSAVSQGSYPIILVDDFSTDDTVARARAIAGSRLKTIRPPRHESLGLTRQSGLMAVETPYGVWLDSDDEMLPGRVDRLIQFLESEHADIIADEAELYDGLQNTFIKRLQIPSFLFGHHPVARLFERNYIPTPGVIGFRTAFAQTIGYDSQLHGSEDIDFLLRCIRAGARFHLLPVPGYRLYAYPQSISRNLDNQRRMYRDLLLKHSYSDVRRLYLEAGHDQRIAAWGLVSFSLFREDYSKALEFVDQAAALMGDPAEVLESEGACDAPEGWRVDFHRGTILLLLGRFSEAITLLENAEVIKATPEGTNNLGVVYRKLGEKDKACRLFNTSLVRFPAFRDAALNLANEDCFLITTHSLRTMAARNDYSVDPLPTNN
jgi:glycosyltransferase involved in cell wall biosynthesis